MTMLLVLVSTPSPPQVSVAEQLLQELHSVVGGNEGQLQASELQVCDSVKVSKVHEAPQPLGTSRVRKDFPPPQGSEQVLQLVQAVAFSRQPKSRDYFVTVL